MAEALAVPRTAVRRIALVGNPNVGKSALFNQLTGLRQKVANYPGVTVERREGTLIDPAGGDVRVLDLPGVRGLVPRSPDEAIAADVLLGRVEGIPAPDAVVVVINTSEMKRGLLLLSQVLEIGTRTIVCLNMVDEARREGLQVDAGGLSRALGGLPVVATAATRGEGIAELRAAALEDSGAPAMPRLPEIPGIHGLPAPSARRFEQLREAVAAAGLEEAEVAARWRWVASVMANVNEARATRLRRRSDRLDRILLHPLLGPVVFLVVMGTVFQAVFSLAAVPMEAIDAGFQALGGAIRDALGAGLLTDFLADGVIAGVGAVLVFLPQIVILFLFLGLLEDSGYMTRAAFLVDRPLRLVGLSGRSFIPLLSSFACAVPGILAARTIDDARERRLTLLVAPLMTCSARLPVYTILIGAFIPAQTVLGGLLNVQGLVLLGLYLFGMVLAALAALVMDRMMARAGRVAPVLELAPYRLPMAKAVALRLWERCRHFLERAGTVILAMAILVWVLTSFPRVEPKPGQPEAVVRSEQLAQSLAGRMGRLLEPVIEPLGYDWRIGIGLVGSFAAREVFVSTMSVVYAAEEDEEGRGLTGAMQAARSPETGEPVYTLATVISLLVFYAIALQCMSTVAVIYRETGSLAWTVGQFVALGALAWVLAFLAYRLVLALQGG